MTMWLPPALLLLSLPGCLSLQGPGSVSGWERGSLTVQCRYDTGWETHRKWWCRGFRWRGCEILVQTTGSEQEVKKGRVSIRDHQKSRTFSVTMEDLRLNDADTYWCGIDRFLTDRGTRVHVTVLPEGTALKVPSDPPPEMLADNHTEPTSVLHPRTHHMLLVFVKVPILFFLVGAVLWLKQSQRTPSTHQGCQALQPCPLTAVASDEEKRQSLDPKASGDEDYGRSAWEPEDTPGPLLTRHPVP